MRRSYRKLLRAGLACLLIAALPAIAPAQTISSPQSPTPKTLTPKTGGVLNFVFGSKVTSYDAHRESTFGVIHPLAPFYSLLIRVDPNQPQSTQDFECDLCEGAVPAPTNAGKTYTFKIRTGVRFHDGAALTAADIKASLDKIIFPPDAVPSARRALFSMVESIRAPDTVTLTIELKFASPAFIPALASPFNWIYSKQDLDEFGYAWHTRNINGTGPFKFIQHQVGAFVEGRKYAAYHHPGQPYLDGFKAISAPKMSVRLQAVRGNRAAIEFRGFPPTARDDLVRVLGSKITVQESDWNCMLGFTPNQSRKPFDDVRVRRALTLAVDRWGGSRYLRNITIVKSVGGIVFPGHPLAASEQELTRLAGYGKNLEAARAEAMRLLKDAGAAGIDFAFHNRGVDQPYKVVGTWLIDQWRKVGFEVSQRVQPTPPFFATLRQKGDFDVSMDANCRSIVNPIADVSKYLGSAGNNYGRYADEELEAIYEKLSKSTELAEQRRLMRAYETRVLDEMAHTGTTLWWYRINPHRSYVKGWNTSPSHYLNQQLDNVWLDR